MQRFNSVTKPFRGWVPCLTLLSAVLLASTLLTKAASAQQATPDASASALQAAHALPELAQSGQFERVRQTLQSTGLAKLDAARHLLSDLERYERNEKTRREKRQAAFQESLAELEKELKAGRIEDAVVATINAHSQSDDPAAFLGSETVKKVEAAAQDAVAEAEKKHDWLTVFSYYRLLDLLFEDSGKYHDPFKRATRHVRVLQFYAPEELKRLSEARKQAREAAADPDDKTDEAPIANGPEIEPDSWQVRLRGVRVSMLRSTLQKAVESHIHSPSYKHMITGSLEAMQVLLATEAIGQTFPGLKDDRKRQRFVRYIDRLHDGIDQPGKNLTRADAVETINSVMSMNEMTVDLPDEVIVYELTQGATDTLDDFSSVIWPEDLSQFKRSTDGKFFGVGIQISRRDGRLVVVSPLPNTPAQKAGIKAGDIIVQVNGRDTASWSLDRAVREITGPKDTVVKLGIERVGEADILQFDLRRDEIVIESVQGWKHTDDGGWDFRIDERHNIGYVRLAQFIPQTAEDLDKAVRHMQKNGGLNGLILDLRFNPGGLLSSAIDISDRFISEGPIVSTVNGDGDQTSRQNARKQRTYGDFPVIVLINRGSASASEIVSGAVQDYRRATVVGQRSFGKGSVQDLYPLDFGRAYFKLTTQYYQLPRGRIIHREPGRKSWGIEPDLVVNMTDKQVARAYEVRQAGDVIREDGEANLDRDGEAMPGVDALIDEGIDAQLETALLLMKINLVADDLAVAVKQ